MRLGLAVKPAIQSLGLGVSGTCNLGKKQDGHEPCGVELDEGGAHACSCNLGASFTVRHQHAVGILKKAFEGVGYWAATSRVIPELTVIKELESEDDLKSGAWVLPPLAGVEVAPEVASQSVGDMQRSGPAKLVLVKGAVIDVEIRQGDYRGLLDFTSAHPIGSAGRLAPGKVISYKAKNLHGKVKPEKRWKLARLEAHKHERYPTHDPRAHSR